MSKCATCGHAPAMHDPNDGCHVLRCDCMALVSVPYRGEADEMLLELARQHLYLAGLHDKGYRIMGWDAFRASLAWDNAPSGYTKAIREALAVYRGEPSKLGDWLKSRLTAGAAAPRAGEPPTDEQIVRAMRAINANGSLDHYRKFCNALGEQ